MPVLFCNQNETPVNPTPTVFYCLNSDGQIAGRTALTNIGQTFSDSELETFVSLQATGDFTASNPDFDITQLDPSIATGLFVAGFLMTLTPWAAAWGFSQLLRLVR